MRDDQRLSDNFMLVIGILIGLVAGVVLLARIAVVDSRGGHVQEDREAQAAIAERIRPIGHVMLMDDVPAVVAPAAPTAAAPLSGPQVYNATCHVCHAPPGVGGAPVVGNAEVWAPRIAQGMDALREHVLNGFQGDAGFMPPKGGRVDLSDEEIISAMQYMVEQAQQ